jgi:hypothetical protein
MKYELWKWSGQRESLAFIAVDENYALHRELMEQDEPGAVLVWSVEAETYNEAMTLYHEYMGWEPYRPWDEKDEEAANQQRLRD